MLPPVEVGDSELTNLEARLLNSSGSVPLHDRFRALFTLKALGDDRAVQVISKAFKDESALLKHELAYVLGQIGRTSAVPILTTTLQDLDEDPMVRHEAAEALGAISHAASIPVLRQYLDDPERCVRETCEIAIGKIEWDSTPEGQAARLQREEEEKEAAESGAIRQFTSTDPAPPSILQSSLSKQQISPSRSVAELRKDLLDTNLPLFTRYRVMFALRNLGTPEAIDALADGFGDDSALFRHEIAFIFGQLSHPHSVPSLLRVLATPTEEDMVRHEAAEALGGITDVDPDKPIVVDGRVVDVLKVLREWMTREDAPLVVKQSCEVAVDMWEYENSDQFQYANALEQPREVMLSAA